MTFNIGEEVICVDNRPAFGDGSPCDLVKGKTYIVLELCPICLTCGCILVKPERFYVRYWSPDRFRRPQVEKDSVLVCDEVDA